MNQPPQATLRWWRRDVSSTPARPVWASSDRPPESFRPVDPPRWVWVDLRGSLRRDPFAFHDDAPGGLQYRYEAKGLLRGWIPAVDGGPLGVVSYQLLTGDLQWRTVVTAFVPRHLIRHDSRPSRVPG